MYAIFAAFTLAERTSAVRLFTERATRHARSWRTVAVGKLGVAVPRDPREGTPIERFVPICPLGAIGFARWGAQVVAAVGPEAGQRRLAADPVVFDALDGLLFPHPDMLARNVVGWSYAEAVDALDCKDLTAQQILDSAPTRARYYSLAAQADEVARAYTAGKLDAPRDLYEGFGVPWHDNTYADVRSDGSWHLVRLGEPS